MEENNYRPYTAKRWTEIPKPVSQGSAVIFTDAQKKRNDAEAERILKEYGVIKSDETIKNGEIIKKDAAQS